MRPSRLDGASPGDERPHTHADRHGSLVRHPCGRWARGRAPGHAPPATGKPLAPFSPARTQASNAATQPPPEFELLPRPLPIGPRGADARAERTTRQRLAGGGRESVVRDRWLNSPSPLPGHTPICRESCDGAGQVCGAARVLLCGQQGLAAGLTRSSVS